MPDDVPRDMRHLCKQFPGARTFIPSNPREGGRCSLYAASERPCPCCDQRRFVHQYQRAARAVSSARGPPRGAGNRPPGGVADARGRGPAGIRQAPGAARGRVRATGRPGTGARPTAERVTGVQGRGWWDQSGRAGSRLSAKARPAAGTAARRREASAGHRDQSGRGRRRAGNRSGPGTAGPGTRAGGDSPGRSRTRTRHAGPRGRLTLDRGG
jgi:hypothetical protein